MSEPLKQWAILELMGHRRLAGLVSETTLAGKGMLRIDVPESEGWAASQLYSPEAVYCMTPTTEEIARAIAETSKPEPAHAWELNRPKAIAGPAEDPGDDFDEDGPACEFCGCTEHNACDGGCRWDEDLLRKDRYVCDRCMRLAREVSPNGPTEPASSSCDSVDF